MRTVCPGWSRPHITVIALADDGKPDGQVSYGMCSVCQQEFAEAPKPATVIVLPQLDRRRNGPRRMAS